MVVTIDDFLITASHQSSIDEFYKLLSQRYNTKKLRRPTEYLGWSITYDDSGSILINEPAMVGTKIENAGMKTANGRLTPYVYSANLRAPDDNDDKVPRMAHSFRQLIGDLRYLTDSTRPDLGYITYKLGVEKPTPTTRHWRALKATVGYLISRPEIGIQYTPITSKGPTVTLLRAFRDASFAADRLEWK